MRDPILGLEVFCVTSRSLKCLLIQEALPIDEPPPPPPQLAAVGHLSFCDQSEESVSDLLPWVDLVQW